MRIRPDYRYVKSRKHPKTGKFYNRFMRKGFPERELPRTDFKPALHGHAFSAAFEAAYRAAVDGQPLAPTPNGAALRSGPGSVNSVVALYLQSSTFTKLSSTTQKQRWPVLNRFRENHGTLPLAKIHRQFIKGVLTSYDGHTARRWFQVIRGLMQFAVEKGFCEVDPTAGIKRPPAPKSDGHATWEESEIALFRSHFAIGTMERLAMELALNTGQRVSDLIRMGRQHIRKNVLTIKQQKTGAQVAIPIHPELAAVLAATPAPGLTFLTNGKGEPWQAHRFSKWFSDAALLAGLPAGYTAHGLRKGCCKRLADMGCTVTEIAAISGHKTLAEVQRYVAAYDRSRAAGAAMAKLVAGGG
jgi:integrase